MLTTCPECRTTFRLGHAQLEARRGLVRCGYCRAVFNAYDTLLPEFETPPATLTESGRLAEPAPLAESAVVPAPEPEAVGIAIPERIEPEADAPADDAFVLSLSERVNEEMPRFEPPPVMPFSDSVPAPADPDTILLSELPTRAQIEPERRTGRKILLGLASLFLFALLLGQCAYFLRGALVTWLPESRSALEAACRPLGCRVPLAAEPTAIRVESSSLETDAEQPNRATLRVNFSNRSRSAQQWPHFILKLTDWQGGPLAQRAFRPADYLAGTDRAAPGMAPMSEREFRLDLDLTGLTASGYEVFPKYP